MPKPLITAPSKPKVLSSTEGFFLNHFDLRQAESFPTEATDPTLPTWVDLVLRLSKSPVISIACIQGRTRGGGNEFTLACPEHFLK